MLRNNIETIICEVGRTASASCRCVATPRRRRAESTLPGRAAQRRGSCLGHTLRSFVDKQILHYYTYDCSYLSITDSVDSRNDVGIVNTYIDNIYIIPDKRQPCSTSATYLMCDYLLLGVLVPMKLLILLFLFLSSCFPLLSIIAGI